MNVQKNWRHFAGPCGWIPEEYLWVVSLITIPSSYLKLLTSSKITLSYRVTYLLWLVMTPTGPSLYVGFWSYCTLPLSMYHGNAAHISLTKILTYTQCMININCSHGLRRCVTSNTNSFKAVNALKLVNNQLQAEHSTTIIKQCWIRHTKYFISYTTKQISKFILTSRLLR